MDWLQLTFPLFKNSDIAKVLLYYPSSNASDRVDPGLFATNGLSGADAVNVSSVASGQQQRAANIYAETVRDASQRLRSGCKPLPCVLTEAMADLRLPFILDGTSLLRPAARGLQVPILSHSGLARSALLDE